MNYRHIFHAGNRCDVAKHAVLTYLITALRIKEKGFAVLDTHGGIGLYDLLDSRALKTAEARDGIFTLLSRPKAASLSAYFQVLARLNPQWSGEGVDHFRVYPGSPLFAFSMLRPQDRLVVCELHPEDAEALRIHAPLDKRLQIHHRDGYEALGAFLPPPEKRGLVFIDPPYEQPNEYDIILKRLQESHHKWPTGLFMIWYPVKDRPAIWKFHEALVATGIKKILVAEFIYDDENFHDRLVGSGLILINPPWKAEEAIAQIFRDLHNAFISAVVRTSIKWLSAD
jgi:23S rRNA (adenine2030-N6)-methyltransferase